MLVSLIYIKILLCLYFSIIFSVNTPCNPSPCSHGTHCSVVNNLTTDIKYKCDCTGTPYQGNECRMIRTKISGIPSQIVAGQETTPIRFHAKPDNLIRITLKSNDDIKFNPPVLTISYPSSFGEFKIKAEKAGKYSIEYDISGDDQLKTIAPPPTILYVQDSASSYRHIQPANVTFENILSATTSCQAYQLDMLCKTTTTRLKFKSSCSFFKHGLISIGSANKADIKFPLSPIGISGVELHGKKYIDLLTTMEDYVLNRPSTECSSSCEPNTIINSSTFDYLVHFGYYPRYVLQSFSKIIGDGVEITAAVPSQSSFSPNNLRLIVGDGSKIEKHCPGHNLDPEDYFVAYAPNFHVDLKVLNSKVQIPRICITYNLCRDKLELSTTRENKIVSNVNMQNIMNDFLPKIILLESLQLKRLTVHRDDGSSRKIFDLDASMRIKIGQILDMKLDGSYQLSRKVNDLKLLQQQRFIRYLTTRH